MPKRGAVRIRVVGNPGGDNPQYVLDAWLGVEFDAIRLTYSPQGFSLVTGTPIRLEKPWAVDVAEAIDALEAAGQEEAVAWWRSQGYPALGGELLFKQDSCLPIELTQASGD